MQQPKIPIRLKCSLCRHEIEGVLSHDGAITVAPCLQCIMYPHLMELAISPDTFNDHMEYYGFDSRWQKGDYFDRTGSRISREKWQLLFAGIESKKE